MLTLKLFLVVQSLYKRIKRGRLDGTVVSLAFGALILDNL